MKKTTQDIEIQHPHNETIKAVIRTYPRSHGYTAFITIITEAGAVELVKVGPFCTRASAVEMARPRADWLLLTWQ